MFLARLLISKFSSPCTNPFVIVPSAPITIGITVTFMFHSFFSSLPRCWYLSLFAFFQFYSFSIVSGGVNQYSSAFLYVVFKSLCQCVNIVFNTGKSSSSFFSWHIICQPHLWDVMLYARLLVFLFTGSFFKVLLWSTSRMVANVLRGGHSRYSSFL